MKIVKIKGNRVHCFQRSPLSIKNKNINICISLNESNVPITNRTRDLITDRLQVQGRDGESKQNFYRRNKEPIIEILWISILTTVLI